MSSTYTSVLVYRFSFNHMYAYENMYEYVYIIYEYLWRLFECTIHISCCMRWSCVLLIHMFSSRGFLICWLLRVYILFVVGWIPCRRNFFSIDLPILQLVALLNGVIWVYMLPLRQGQIWPFLWPILYCLSCDLMQCYIHDQK